MLVLAAFLSVIMKIMFGISLPDVGDMADTVGVLDASQENVQLPLHLTGMSFTMTVTCGMDMSRYNQQRHLIYRDTVSCGRHANIYIYIYIFIHIYIEREREREREETGDRREEIGERGEGRVSGERDGERGGEGRGTVDGG